PRRIAIGAHRNAVGTGVGQRTRVDPSTSPVTGGVVVVEEPIGGRAQEAEERVHPEVLAGSAIHRQRGGGGDQVAISRQRVEAVPVEIRAARGDPGAGGDVRHRRRLLEQGAVHGGAGGEAVVSLV